jgi:hypothetical protein
VTPDVETGPLSNPDPPTKICTRCGRPLSFSPPWRWTPGGGRVTLSGPFSWQGPSGDSNCYLSDDETVGFPHDPAPDADFVRHGEPPGCGKWNCVLCNALPQTADTRGHTHAPEDDRGGFQSGEQSPCVECGKPTYRIDICFEAHLHYDCAPEAERKYWEAVVAPPNDSDGILHG